MELSFALPTSGSWATPENVTLLARAAESRGCRGLWTFQRVIYPSGSDLPAVYRSVLDPLVTLGFAAPVTSRVRLGLAVVNGPFYAPAVLAKQLATVDVLSTGRLDAGIGLGWLPDEFAAVGVPMRARGRRFDEWLDCLNTLLAGDGEVTFTGEFYTVPPSRMAPRPVQRPRPPLLIGGSSEAAYRRGAVRGDGWISSSRASLDDIRFAIGAMREAAEGAGKSPSSVRSVVRGVTAVRTRPLGPDRGLLHGSLEQIRDDIGRFAETGVDELFFDLNFDSEQVGNPDADPAAAMDKAYAVLEHCLPAAG